MILDKKKQKELDEQLLDAAASGTTLRVKQLLDLGASVSARDEDTLWTVLHLACYFDKAKICSLLLGRGANANAEAADGLTPLLIASSLASVEVAQLLLNAHAKVNVTDSKGYSPLMLAADRPDADMTDLLMSYEANPNMKSSQGLTAMDIARDRGAPGLAAELEGAIISASIASVKPQGYKAKCF